jgi:hypothetical protein
MVGGGWGGGWGGRRGVVSVPEIRSCTEKRALRGGVSDQNSLLHEKTGTERWRQ